MKIKLFIVAFVALLAAVMFTNVASAQPGRGGGGFMGGGSMGLLMNEDVRKELEIVEDQEKKLREVGEKMREKMREAFSGMRDASSEDRQAMWEKARTKMREVQTEMQKDVDKILLPHQRDRLKQLALQQSIRYRGMSGALGGDTLSKELGLTEKQKEKLRAKAEEVQKKLQERIAKLRKEAEEDLLDVLTPEQQAKIKKLIGEQFEMPQRDRGRGGRGGERGGR